MGAAFFATIMNPISEKQLFEIYTILKRHFESKPNSQTKSHHADFLNYLMEKIDENKTNGNQSACDKIRTARNKFCSFLIRENNSNGRELPFESVTSELMKKFESSLKSEMLSMNTISFYMRILRTYYNRAATEWNLSPNANPFKSVYTGIPVTKKRGVDIGTIMKIKNAVLPPQYHFSRDIFLFSFYTRGMAFVDIAHLKWKNVSKREIMYFRQKTGQEIHITLEPCIQTIINTYGIEGYEYVFPILQKIKYHSAIRKYNRHLREISSILELPKSLSSYVARHSWASIAKNAGVPIRTISEGMGHTSEKTTQIYLASLNRDTIDEANKLVISISESISISAEGKDCNFK